MTNRFPACKSLFATRERKKEKKHTLVDEIVNVIANYWVTYLTGIYRKKQKNHTRSSLALDQMPERNKRVRLTL